MIVIRDAQPDDCDVIVRFNAEMALETEDLELDRSILSTAIAALLDDKEKGMYFMAEIDGQIVGQSMVTTEWSDWRNGLFWWIQSVFVEPAYRRCGIYRRMYAYVKKLAGCEPQVCGFRLYVEKDNRRAQKTYLALGMKQSPYFFFEALKAGVDNS